jgi:hypothetical protein
MNHRQLYRRISNLDRLYLLREQCRDAADEEHDQETKLELHRVADGFAEQYRRLVNDKRRIDA